MPDLLRNRAVLKPNLGLYFDVPAINVPARGLLDGLNFRVKNGTLSNLNLGWSTFGSFNPLNGPVALIDNFFLRTGAQVLIFGTTKDLYKYVEGDGSVAFITPVETTGTVDVSAADPAVVTSASGPTVFDTNGVKSGDQISFGASDESDPDATWYEIDTVDSDTQLTLTSAVSGAPLAGQAYTIRKLFSGDLLDPWDVATFVNDETSGDDLWFATNGVDDIVTWNGTDDFCTQQASLGFTCRHLAVYSNMMIYADVTTSGGTAKPTTIINSDVGKPLDVSGGLAGEFVVHDGTDPVNAIATMGDNMIVYAPRHVAIVQFVGDPLVFTFRVGFVGIGPISGRLVSDFGDFHEFVGADTKYTFDGVTVEESGSHAWRDILRQRDPNRTPMAYAHFDEEQGDLIWVIPLTSDSDVGSNETATPEVAYPEHYLEDIGPRDPVPVSKRTFPFTASGFYERQSTLTWDQISDQWQEVNYRWNDSFFLAAFPFNLVGDEDGKVYTLNTSQDRADGTALQSFVRFRRVPSADGRMRAMLRRIYLYVGKFNDVTLNVKVFLSEHGAGPITDSETFTLDLDLPEGGHFVSPFRAARFFEFQIGTDGPGEPWEISGYDFDIVRGGRR